MSFPPVRLRTNKPAAMPTRMPDRMSVINPNGLPSPAQPGGGRDRGQAGRALTCRGLDRPVSRCCHQPAGAEGGRGAGA